MNKTAFNAWLNDYREALTQAAGIAYILGFSDHAKILHELSCQAMGIDTEVNRRQNDIDTAAKTRYHKGNQANTPRKQEEKKMKIDKIVAKINNSCKPFDIDDLREIFTAANSAEGLKLLKHVNDSDDIPIDIIDSALYDLGYQADEAGTYRKL